MTCRNRMTFALGALVVLFLSAICLPAQAALVGHWVADGWSGGDWSNQIGGANAAVAVDNPSLIAGALNGHDAIHLDGNDYFTVAAGAGNPMAGANDFSITVVMRTDTAGLSFGGVTNPDDFWRHSGLIGMELPSGTVNDWALSFNSESRIIAGLGNPDRSVFSTSGHNDSAPHVATYTRQGGQISLYVDGYLKSSRSDVGTAARLDQAFAIGAVTSGGFQPFTGDIAEVRIHDTALSPVEAVDLAQSLDATYGITPPGTVTPIAHWSANDLAGTTGAAVGTWTDQVGGVNAAAGTGTPTLVAASAEMNGNNAVKFDGADDQLRVAAAASPMAGARAFTIATVFRTEVAGAGGVNWWDNSGIVDMELPGHVPDWGLVIRETGQIGAGIGNVPSGSPTLYSALANLHDGRPHVAVYRRNPASGVIQLTVDGNTVSLGDRQPYAMSAADFVFGSIQTNIGYFNGEIADVRIWDREISASETSELTSELLAAYAPAPVARWVADDLNAALNTNDAVAAWTDGVGGAAAAAGTGVPAFVEASGAFNWHSSVRFDGLDDQLRVLAGDNPIGGAEDFSVAVVFRSDGGGLTEGTDGQWYRAAGNVDGEQPGVAADWGMVLFAEGDVGPASATRTRRSIPRRDSTTVRPTSRSCGATRSPGKFN